jgi:hypothetical protein|tara:strand:- start:105 stop:944 length:840 start_codon:yes stop_codon:yes gene_type:complete
MFALAASPALAHASVASRTHPATTRAARARNSIARPPTRRSGIIAHADGDAVEGIPVSGPGAQPDPNDLKAVVDAAERVPANISQEDFTAFYGILQAQSAEEAATKVTELVDSGRLTEGVVEAALSTLTKAEEKGEPDEVIQTLRAVFEYLVEAYSYVSAPPSLEAVDEVVRRLGDMEQLKMKDELKMSDDEYENNAVKEAAKVAEITLEQFSEDVGKFLASMEEQDAGFEDQVKQLLAQPGADTPEQREQLDQMRAMRKGAKEQMVRVSGILGRCIAA